MSHLWLLLKISSLEDQELFLRDLFAYSCGSFSISALCCVLKCIRMVPDEEKAWQGQVFDDQAVMYCVLAQVRAVCVHVSAFMEGWMFYLLMTAPDIVC